MLVTDGLRGLILGMNRLNKDNRQYQGSCGWTRKPSNIHHGPEFNKYTDCDTLDGPLMRNGWTKSWNYPCERMWYRRHVYRPILTREQLLSEEQGAQASLHNQSLNQYWRLILYRSTRSWQNSDIVARSSAIRRRVCRLSWNVFSEEPAASIFKVQVETSDIIMVRVT